LASEASGDMSIGLEPPIPILRMFDVDATIRFYVDYLGCALDWQEGGPDGPAFIQVSRGPLILNLSSHHGDGTPGGVVLVYIDDVDALHAELHAKNYPFMNPGIEPHGAGRELVLLDPASNQIRFFERPTGKEA
jgi:catechol 2,3-dioxygenase-like lactoylglutathione lyase family enzyme